MSTASFQSPSYLQLEGLSAQGDLLAVSCSALGGNEWHGEIRVFKTGDQAPVRFETIGAVRLDYGSSCCKLVRNCAAVCCGTDDGNVLVFRIGEDYQLASGAHLKLAEHDDLVSCLDVNDTAVVSGSWDRSAKIWDAQTGKVKETIDCGDQVTSVQFVDANVIATGERDGSLGLWDIRQGLIARKSFDHGICSLAVSEQQFVIVGCADGSVVEWTPQSSMNQVLRKHNASVHALSVCPVTKRLLSGSDDGAVFGVGRVHQDFIRGAAWWKGRPVTSSWDGTMRFVDVDVV